MPIKLRIFELDETEEELLNMTRNEASFELSDRERAFCEHYIKNYNIKVAAIKAGYSAKSAHIVGWKLRQLYKINLYIAWLKVRVSIECHVNAKDVIDQYIKIAFADVTDFVEIDHNKLKLVDSNKIDGQLVKSVKQGKDGISIELVDKLAALDKLTRYFDAMPADWKQKIEERKVELMEQRIEIERQKLGNTNAPDDDGFLDAIKEMAQEVWEDEEADI